jgi:MFS family permease
MSQDTSGQIGYLPLLRSNPGFFWMWLSKVISNTGDWFTSIALYAMLLEYTGSGRAMGLLLIVILLPGLIFNPLGGMLADRFDRKKLLILCSLVRGATVLAYLLVRGPADVWLLYVLRFTQSSLAATFDSSEKAAISSVLRKHEVVTANTILYGITSSAMMALGTLAGGVVSAWLGRSTAFTIDAATFFIAAFCVSRVSLPPLERSSKPAAGRTSRGLRQWVEELRPLFRDRSMRLVLLAKAAWGLSGGGIMVLYSVLGAQVFPVGGSADMGIGVVYTARGIGAMLGAPLARWLGGDDERSLVRGIGASFLVMMLGFGLLGLTPQLLPAMGFLALGNMAMSTLWVYSTALINFWVPNELRGRAFAVDATLFNLGLMVSAGITGVGTDGLGLGPQEMMLVLASLLLVPTVGWWLGTRQRTPAAATSSFPDSGAV